MSDHKIGFISNREGIKTMEHHATSYLHDLCGYMWETQVTDWRGQVLSLDDGISKAVEMFVTVAMTSGKAMLIGNGGSAAIVSHIQNDLCKAANIRAMVFNEQPLLTALSNDLGYESVFERPIELWASTGDLLLAISSSGQSENILRAVQAAVVQGCQIITFSGFRPDNPLRDMGDMNFYVPAQAYGFVEIAHMALAHCLTDYTVAAQFKPERAGD